TKNRAFRLLEVSLTEQDSVRFSFLVLLSTLPSLSCPNRTVKNLHLSGGAGGDGRHNFYSPLSYSLFPIPYSLFPVPRSLFPVP
ncbi:MAG: hypothetical protein RIE73_06485, partial [Coleofasciculus sp. C1-SOL-03]